MDNIYSVSEVLDLTKEVAKADASASVIMSVNNSLVCYLLQKYSSEFIKENYLKDFTRKLVIIKVFVLIKFWIKSLVRILILKSELFVMQCQIIYQLLIYLFH